MHEPAAHHDDDRPARGSPRLLGDKIGRLSSYRRTAELRVGSPGAAQSHHFHRNLIICIAIKAGLRQEVVAEAMGLSRSRVTHIVAEMESLLPPTDPAA